MQQNRICLNAVNPKIHDSLSEDRLIFSSAGAQPISLKLLKAEVKNLQQQIHEHEQQAENIGQFVQRVKRNSTLTELTSYALRELVKAVYVDAPDKSSGKRRQKVHIEYDPVGYIPVDELLKAEQT